MSEEWAGVSIASQNLVIVRLRFEGDDVYVVDDSTWDLQEGERTQAYGVMYERVLNYLKENSIQTVVIKSSAVSVSVRKPHLAAAELRGVIMAAVALSGVSVEVSSKAHVSKTFGTRKTDEYVEDSSFWENQLQGTIRKGSREIALLILAARKSR